MRILVWIVKSWANSVLSQAGICMLRHFLTRNTRRTWFRYDSKVCMSFWAIQIAFSISRFFMTHEFLGLEVSAGPWISNVSWRLINSGSCIGGTKPVDLSDKWIHFLVFIRFNQLHILSSISARAGILIFFICLFSFHHRIEGCNPNNLDKIKLTTHGLPYRSFLDYTSPDRSFQGALTSQTKLLSLHVGV